jgi:hypothetical protein
MGYKNKGEEPCMICFDSISDPMCTNCYIKQTKILFRELNSHSLDNDDILDILKRKYSLLERDEGSLCILCSQKKTSVCRYCYSIFLRKILEEFKFSEEMIHEFGCDEINDIDLHVRVDSFES